MRFGKKTADRKTDLDLETGQSLAQDVQCADIAYLELFHVIQLCLVSAREDDQRKD